MTLQFYFRVFPSFIPSPQHLNQPRQLPPRCPHVLCIVLAALFAGAIPAQDATDAPDPLAEILAGHSAHGSAFNEGARQAARILGGTGNVDFPATTDSEMAQRFINQGVGQLHGFWDLEAERSFRQAAMLDPDCAITYWGAALATFEQPKRAAGFIEEAFERMGDASEREQRYIKALHRYFRGEPKKPSKPKSPSKPKKIEESESEETECDESNPKDAEPEYELIDDSNRKSRSARYLRDLEDIVLDYPDDVEAKAFVVHRIWHNARAGIEIGSYVAAEALLKEIFEINPLHPAHHYRIHVWDRRSPSQALESAGMCGLSAPSIAHMWHMPGHIFSRLHRYDDAVYYQEASARTDHRHMITDHVIPDEIHNYAHNNEWLTRNCVCLGRATDALQLAINLVDLPRHPKYNTVGIERRGSMVYGVQRLLQVLREFQMRDAMSQVVRRGCFNHLHESQLVDVLRLQACFAAFDGEESSGNRFRKQLETMLAETEASQSEAESRVEEIEQLIKEANETSARSSTRLIASNAAKLPDDSSDCDVAVQVTCDPCEEKNSAACDEASLEKVDAAEVNARDVNQSEDNATSAVVAADNSSEESSVEVDIDALKSEKDDAKSEIDELKKKVKSIKNALLAIDGYAAVSKSEYLEAAKLLDEAGQEDASWIAELKFHGGEQKAALEELREQVDKRTNEAIPLARLVWCLSENGDDREAKVEFEKLRHVAIGADASVEIFARLNGLANRLDYGVDWILETSQPDPHSHFRPALDALGPIHWRPSTAPSWAVVDTDNNIVTSDSYAGKNYLMIFYLGYGCLHCAEQLQAFGPRVADFEAAGIEMIAISSDEQANLSKSLAIYDGEMPIRLASDSKLEIFKRFRAHDDFEGQPLHGTFLIDAKGKIRWQDIGYEPFMDHEFLLNESKRLLEFDMAD